MALVSQGKGATLGDLYILPFSPWSKRVLVAQHSCHAPVTMREYKPPLSEFILWVRMRFAKRKITSPAFFPHGGGEVLMDGEAISRVLDAARTSDSFTLFPPEHDPALRILLAHAETVASYGRAETFRNLDGAAFKSLLFPRWMRGLPFTDAIARLAIRMMNKKYAEESEKCTEEKARIALTAIRDAITASKGEEFRFLVGEALSYADIAVGLSLIILCEDKTSFIPFSRMHPIGKDFLDVKQWGDDFLHKYVTAEAVSFPPPQYDAEGNVVSV